MPRPIEARPRVLDPATTSLELPSGTELNDNGRVREEQLVGGVANAGAVVRVGEHVLRPSNAHSRAVHTFLCAIRAAGFEGASAPVGIDPDGRERLVLTDGDVPVPPYPAWARSDTALTSIAALLAGLHRASRTFDPRVAGRGAPGWPTRPDGLDRPGRIEFLPTLDDSIAKGGAFVRRRVEAGDPNFIAMWNDMGGALR